MERERGRENGSFPVAEKLALASVLKPLGFKERANASDPNCIPSTSKTFFTIYFLFLMNFGPLYLFNKSEFATTETEENAIANPAISGLKADCERFLNICAKLGHPQSFIELKVSITHGAGCPFI